MKWLKIWLAGAVTEGRKLRDAHEPTTDSDNMLSQLTNPYNHSNRVVSRIRGGYLVSQRIPQKNNDDKTVAVFCADLDAVRDELAASFAAEALKTGA